PLGSFLSAKAPVLRQQAGPYPDTETGEQAGEPDRAWGRDTRFCPADDISFLTLRHKCDMMEENVTPLVDNFPSLVKSSERAPTGNFAHCPWELLYLFINFQFFFSPAAHTLLFVTLFIPLASCSPLGIV
ncbi:unnamed protein product, partial [Coregonus sp. 'balchen']